LEPESSIQVRKAAEGFFASGLYCAESVVLAIARAWGVESELLPKAATAFCSGMARTCGPCGALSGAIMSIGLFLGRSSAEQSVQPCYAPTQQLIRQFEREFGARNCNDLLGCDLGTPEGQAEFREHRLHERCTQYTGRAAEMAARLILEATRRETQP
jgi:C_GCAxxG_C_C family probable redox protein